MVLGDEKKLARQIEDSTSNFSRRLDIFSAGLSSTLDSFAAAFTAYLPCKCYSFGSTWATENL